MKSLAVYHMFFSVDRSRDIGGEFDALISKELNEHVTVLGKLAVFHSESKGVERIVCSVGRCPPMRDYQRPATNSGRVGRSHAAKVVGGYAGRCCWGR